MFRSRWVIGPLLVFILLIVVFCARSFIVFPKREAWVVDKTRFIHDGEQFGSTMYTIWDTMGGYLHQDYYFDNIYIGRKGQEYDFRLWLNGRTGQVEKVILVLPTYWPNSVGL